jgi:carboxylesterase
MIKNTHLDGDSFWFEGQSTGIMLIHGYRASTAEMRPLGEFLHKQGFTVSGPLLPGHNTYPKDINNFTWQDWVATAENAYTKLASHCDRVWVGGESTGGLISLYLAANHPEIMGLLTYAPALKLNIRWIEVVKLYLAAPFIPYIPPKNPHGNDDLAWRGYTVNPLKGIIQLLRLQKRSMARLEAIKNPILIIQGRLDDTIAPDVPEIIYNKVNSVIKKIHWLENSHHCVVLDQEQSQVHTLTLNFINHIQG